MDKIIIKSIKFHGNHGVPEAEREVGGHYEIDAALGCSLVDAGKSDALEDTIDYAGVVDLIVDIGTQKSFHLIEALAETICSEILRQFPVETVHLIVKKLHPPINQPIAYFAVEIYREKE
ncbi:MAG: dihydroneopterin aldolase [Candidatus Poribacteria bacterium]|nr:dihydroneopterin aldolase [Candidatus Poribacteria bacterium]